MKITTAVAITTEEEYVRISGIVEIIRMIVDVIIEMTPIRELSQDLETTIEIMEEETIVNVVLDAYKP